MASEHRSVTRPAWRLAAGLVLANAGVHAATPARLELVTPSNTVDTIVSEVIVREAYARLGTEVIIEKFPAERAIRLANAGEAAGEVQRIDGIDKTYTNLVQVRPPINYIEATAFTKTETFRVQGWASLQPYRIGIVRGIKFAERNTRGMDTRLASDYAELFRMLDRGLYDVAVSPAVNGWYQIAKANLTRIRDLQPPVERFDLFHYLHRDHADLVPAISGVLEDMRRAGELAAIRERVIRVMMNRAEAGQRICDDDYACFEADAAEH